MPFSIRPFRRFPVPCAVTYNAWPFLKLPLAYFLGFTSLITLLLLSSGPAYAEWVRVGYSDDGSDIYTDPDIIRRKGDLVKVWSLIDYKTLHTRDFGSFFSIKNRWELDCADERMRLLAFVHYSDNMGHGKVVFSSSEEFNRAWGPVIP